MREPTDGWDMQLKRVYLEGHGGLVSRLLMGVTGVTRWVIGVTSILTSTPDPPSRASVYNHIVLLAKALRNHCFAF